MHGMIDSPYAPNVLYSAPDQTPLPSGAQIIKLGVHLGQYFELGLAMQPLSSLLEKVYVVCGETCRGVQALLGTFGQLLCRILP